MLLNTHVILWSYLRIYGSAICISWSMKFTPTQLPVNANFVLISKKRTKILSPVYGGLKHTMPPAAQGTWIFSVRVSAKKGSSARRITLAATGSISYWIWNARSVCLRLLFPFSTTYCLAMEALWRISSNRQRQISNCFHIFMHQLF